MCALNYGVVRRLLQDLPLGSPASVTFLGIKSLTENNRTLRMAESLAKRKAKVIICTTAPESDDREIGTIFEMSDGVQGIYLY